MSDPCQTACCLEGEEFQRRVIASREVLGTAESVSETARGYVFEFGSTSARLRELTELIDAERRCCPFLAFTLAVPVQGRPFRLEITGPDGAKGFIRAELLGAV
jgi:hypothetical protein